MQPHTKDKVTDWKQLRIIDGLALVVIPMLFSLSLRDPWNPPRLLVLSGLLTVGALIALWRRAVMPIRSRGIYAVAAGWIVWQAVCTLASAHWGEGIYLLGMRLAACLWVVWLCRRQDMGMISLYGLVLGMLQGLLGLGESIGLVDMQTEAYGPCGTTGNPNLWASLLVMLLPCAGMCAATGNRRLRVAGLAGLGLGLGCIILAGSMASFLALGVMGGFLLCMASLVGKWKEWILKHSFWMVLLPLSIVCLPIIWAGLDFDGTQRVDLSVTSVTERAYLWRASLDIAADHPVMGVGLAGWKYEVLAAGNVAPSTDFGTRYYAQPHNDFLGMATGAGLLGALLYVALLSILFVLAARQGLAATAAADRWRAWLLAAGVLAWCIFSSLQFPIDRMDHLMVLGVFAAMILAGERPGNQLMGRSSRILWIGTGILSIALLVLGGMRWQHETHMTRLLQAKRVGNWKVVLLEAERSESAVFPTEFYSSTPIAWHEGLALQQLGESSKAVAALRRARSINPAHPHVLNNLGSAFVAVQQLDSAIASYQSARKLFPEFADPYLNLAQIYLALGDTGQSKQILLSYPDLPGKGRDIVIGTLRKYD